MSDRIVHTQDEAFRLGRADRLERRPITCYVAIVDGVRHEPEEFAFWDEGAGQELDRAYLAGYDPNNDLGLTKPEYVAEELEFAKRMFAKNGLPLPAGGEKLSACDEAERAQGHPAVQRAIVATDRKRDQDRLNWIESQTTLHRSVDILYVVDGYAVTVIDSTFGRAWEKTFHGTSFREAIDAAMREIPEGP